MPRSNNNMGRAANGLGSIRKKSVKKGGKAYEYWEARVTVGFNPMTGKQVQRSITGKTQKEVAQKMKEIAVEIDRGTYQAPCKMTVAEWLDIWQKEYLYDVRPSTAQLYKRSLTLYIIPNVGKVKLEALTPHMIQKMLNTLSQQETRNGTLSPKTVKNVRGILHKALQQAVENQYIRYNPVTACKPPRSVKTEIQPMTEEQQAAFVSEIRGHQHEYLYLIALFTGIRESEVLVLTWDCVDFKHGTLTVKQQLKKASKKSGELGLAPTKNGKTRTIALAPTVLQYFRLQRLRQNSMRLEAGDLWTEKKLVFTNQTGDYLSYRGVYDCFKRIVRNIGCPGVRFHDMRHTYAVNCIAGGDDIKTVQENMGHATSAFTLDVYGHVFTQMRVRSAEHTEAHIQKLLAASQ